ncbi:MAG TPA: hypothetical protein VG818_13325 [Gemmatimonadaceae bacterium]|nr:hypothetical protein [Gemmatimonadaceae bacterium]
MTDALAARQRPLSVPRFALLAFAICALEAWIARSPRALVHPSAVPVAVALDLGAFVPLLYWWLVVRPSRASVGRVLAVVVLGLIAARPILRPEQRAVLRYARAFTAPFELMVVGMAIAAIRRGARAASADRDVDVPDRIATSLAGAFAYPAVGAAIATEVSILYYALFSWRDQPHVPPGATPFTCHRRSAIVPLLGAVAGIAVVELFAVHLVVHTFSPAAAWSLTALSAVSVAWIIGFARAVALRPILVFPDRVVARGGLGWLVEIPRDAIASAQAAVRTGPQRGAEGHVQILGRGQPTVTIGLARPLVARGAWGRAREVRSVGLTVDRPREFLEAVG